MNKNPKKYFFRDIFKKLYFFVSVNNTLLKKYIVFVIIKFQFPIKIKKIDLIIFFFMPLYNIANKELLLLLLLQIDR